MRNILRIFVLKAALKAATLLCSISLALFFTLSLSSFNISADSSPIPTKGMTQSEVKATFGEPISARAPVGKPPIIRWDYTDYSVYFEGNYVIHSFHYNQRRQAVAPQAVSLAPETKPVPEVKTTDDAEANIAEPIAEPTVEPVVESVVETQEPSTTATEIDTPDEAPLVEEIKADVEVTTPIKETVPKAAAEKDLNFEETETKTDFGKWGY